MKNFSDATLDDIETLSQAHTRLMAEGFISISVPFGDFLDCVYARGDYKNTSIDEIVKEGI